MWEHDILLQIGTVVYETSQGMKLSTLGISNSKVKVTQGQDTLKDLAALFSAVDRLPKQGVALC